MSFISQLDANENAYLSARDVFDAQKATSDAAVYTAFKAAYGLSPDAHVDRKNIVDMWNLVEKIEDVPKFIEAISATAYVSYNARHQ